MSSLAGGDRLFSMAFKSVSFGGLSRHWWRYLIHISFEVMAYALLAVCCVFFQGSLGVVAVGICSGLSGNIHNPVVGFLVSLCRHLLS